MLREASTPQKHLMSRNLVPMVRKKFRKHVQSSSKYIARRKGAIACYKTRPIGFADYVVGCLRTRGLGVCACGRRSTVAVIQFLLFELEVWRQGNYLLYLANVAVE